MRPFVHTDVLKYRDGFTINIKPYSVCVTGRSNSGKWGGAIDDCIKNTVIKCEEGELATVELHERAKITKI